MAHYIAAGDRSVLSAGHTLLAAAVWGVHVLSGSSQPIAARLDAHVRPARVNLEIREFGGAERAPIRHYDRDMTKSAAQLLPPGLSL